MVEKSIDYVCSKCGADVSFNHKDDVGTKFYKCGNCDALITNPIIKKVCGDCKFHLKRGVCPRAEYRTRKENLIACMSTDAACELFQSKKKKKDEPKEKIARAQIPWIPPQ